MRSASIVVLVCICIICVGVWLFMRTNGSYLAEVTSPDGTMVAKVKDINRLLVVQIFSVKGSQIFSDKTSSSSLHRWSMHWESNDRLTLDSSDDGGHSWIRDGEGKWSLFDDGSRSVARNEYTVNGMHVVHEVKRYYSDGRPYSEGLYVSNDKHGKWIWWNRDGTVKMVKYYRHGKILQAEGDAGSTVGKAIWQQIVVDGKHTMLDECSTKDTP